MRSRIRIRTSVTFITGTRIDLGASAGTTHHTVGTGRAHRQRLVDLARRKKDTVEPERRLELLACSLRGKATSAVCYQRSDLHRRQAGLTEIGAVISCSAPMQARLA